MQHVISVRVTIPLARALLVSHHRGPTGGPEGSKLANTKKARAGTSAGSRTPAPCPLKKKNDTPPHKQATNRPPRLQRGSFFSASLRRKVRLSCRVARPLLGLVRYSARPGPRPFGAIERWRARCCRSLQAILCAASLLTGIRLAGQGRPWPAYWLAFARR